MEIFKKLFESRTIHRDYAIGNTHFEETKQIPAYLLQKIMNAAFGVFLCFYCIPASLAFASLSWTSALNTVVTLVGVGYIVDFFEGNREPSICYRSTTREEEQRV